MKIRTFFHFLLVTFYFLMSSTSPVNADGKRALKLLSKGDYEKLRDYLDKSLERDSINPGAQYVYALLYITDEYPHYNIDSANWHNVQAAKHWEVAEENTKEKLIKDGIDSTAIDTLQMQINRRAFVSAIATDSLFAYEHYVDNFTTSRWLDSAKSLRNQKAFSLAEQENTYAAYKSFAEKYPQASQYTVAKERYEKLYFLKMTKGESMEDYQKFLEDNPDSPYRIEAEKNILEIATADNMNSGYAWFLETYPQSTLHTKALSMLYYNLKEEGQEASFFSNWKDMPETDSIRQVYEREQETWLPFFDDSGFGLMNSNGTIRHKGDMDSLEYNYRCGGITEDLLVINGNIVNRAFEVVVPHSVGPVQDLGYGIFTLHTSAGYQIWHKSGFQISRHAYDTVRLLGRYFMQATDKGEKEILTFSGRSLWKGDVDDISVIGRFLLFTKADQLAVVTINELSAQAGKSNLHLTYNLEEAEWITDYLLLVYKGDQEGLLATDGEMKIPVGNHIIYPLDRFTLVRKEDRYTLYNADFEPVYDKPLESAIFKNRILAVKKDGLWAFTHTNNTGKLLYYYDSVRLMGEKVILLRRGENLWANFDNDTLVKISYAKDVRMLTPASEEGVEYLLVKDEDGKSHVFNEHGRKVIEDTYEEITALGKNYLIVTSRGKKGLYFKDGTLISKPKYDAIGNPHNGYVSVLNRNSFGVINHEKNIQIDARYEKLLKPYGEKYFIATYRGEQGLIDLEGNKITDYQFQHIMYWSDSLAIVSTEDGTFFYDITQQTLSDKDIVKTELLAEYEDGKAYRVVFGVKEGVYHTQKGVLVGATFNIVKNYGSYTQPLFFAEKFVDEANIYVAIYYSASGEILKKQVFSPEEYDKIYCD